VGRVAGQFHLRISDSYDREESYETAYNIDPKGYEPSFSLRGTFIAELLDYSHVLAVMNQAQEIYYKDYENHASKNELGEIRVLDKVFTNEHLNCRENAQHIQKKQKTNSEKSIILR
jgi:hypothetical protein